MSKVEAVPWELLPPPMMRGPERVRSLPQLAKCFIARLNGEDGGNPGKCNTSISYSTVARDKQLEGVVTSHSELTLDPTARYRAMRRLHGITEGWVLVYNLPFRGGDTHIEARFLVYPYEALSIKPPSQAQRTPQADVMFWKNASGFRKRPTAFQNSASARKMFPG